jgi:hypothetical protein
MKIRIKAQMDVANKEEAGAVFERIWSEACKALDSGQRTGSDAAGIVGNYSKFKDRARHGEAPDPLVEVG